MEVNNKQHRQSRVKVKREKLARTIEQTKGRNAKAFVNSGSIKNAQRTADLQENKLRLPVNIKDTVSPVIVAVMGPPGSGKTTLIKSLIRKYSKQTISQINGPLTVVSGRDRRLQFVEVPNNLCAQIDIAKVADLVLLVIDGHFGFEMETFEFLNILAPHGMPKVLGVLTHLDQFKDSAKLRNQKKILKQRFWNEIYQGAKLFYLSGILNNRYPDREILNLSRFINVMKTRPLQWRLNHSYVLCDRMEDLTPAHQLELAPMASRDIVLFGYLHGPNMKPGKVHVPGIGDLEINSMSVIPDPCPPSSKTAKRSLSEKKRLLYAPMSDVGGILIDQDAVYIDMKTNDLVEDQELGKGEEMLVQLQKQAVRKSNLQLITGGDLVSDASSFTDEDEERLNKEDFISEDEEEEENCSAYKKNDAPSALKEYEDNYPSNLGQFGTNGKNINELIYNMNLPIQDVFNDKNSEKKVHDDDFFQVKSSYTKEGDPLLEDCWKQNISDKVDYKKVRARFITADNVSDSEIGDFEMIENDDGINNQAEIENENESHDEISEIESLTEDSLNDDDDDDIQDDEDNDAIIDSTTAKLTDVSWDALREQSIKKKQEYLAKFSAQDRSEKTSESTWFDEQKAKFASQNEQTDIILNQLKPEAKIEMAGVGPGNYVRMLINDVPPEFVQNFDPRQPLIVGSLTEADNIRGIVHVRIKKHRWHKKILKTNDPLIFSVGWRRFQSCPIYTTTDSRTRHRMLKYTPEHMHCFAYFYGPAAEVNTGFCAFQHVSKSKTSGMFRVAASGTILGSNQSSEIVKKIKLTGFPVKIQKNTAFIKDMFSSSLEVAKFEGAMIRTVSGIRGQIKKPLRSPEGQFRAIFQDKILMSDIVFLRAWVPIEVRQYYNPVSNLLLENNEEWTGMRLTGEIRREEDIKTIMKPDSTYKKIERPERRFNPLKVPRQLQAELPFEAKIRQMKKQKNETYMQKRAVLVAPEERQQRDLIQKMMKLQKDKIAKRNEKKAKERAMHLKKQHKLELQVKERQESRRKEYFKKQRK